MKIRILKSTKPDSWYADKIGKEYVVKKIGQFQDFRFYIVRNYRTLLRTVNINDAYIIER